MGVVGEPGVSSKVRTVRVACPHDCPDGCSMRVSVDNESGRAIKVEGDPTHPVTRGYLWQQGQQLPRPGLQRKARALSAAADRAERPGREIPAHRLGRSARRNRGKAQGRDRGTRRRSGPAVLLFRHARHARILRHGRTLLQQDGRGEAGAHDLHGCGCRGRDAYLRTRRRRQHRRPAGHGCRDPVGHEPGVHRRACHAVRERSARQRCPDHRHRSARDAHHRLRGLACPAASRHRRGTGAGHDESHRRSRPARPRFSGTQHGRLEKTAGRASAGVHARIRRGDYRDFGGRRRKTGLALRRHEAIVHPRELGHPAPRQRRPDDPCHQAAAGDNRRDARQGRRMHVDRRGNAARGHAPAAGHLPARRPHAAHHQHDPARQRAQRPRPADQGLVLLERGSGQLRAGHHFHAQGTSRAKTCSRWCTTPSGAIPRFTRISCCCRHRARTRRSAAGLRKLLLHALRTGHRETGRKPGQPGIVPPLARRWGTTSRVSRSPTRT